MKFPDTSTLSFPGKHLRCIFPGPYLRGYTYIFWGHLRLDFLSRVTHTLGSHRITLTSRIKSTLPFHNGVSAYVWYSGLYRLVPSNPSWQKHNLSFPVNTYIAFRGVVPPGYYLHLLPKNNTYLILPGQHIHYPSRPTHTIPFQVVLCRIAFPEWSTHYPPSINDIHFFQDVIYIDFAG